MNGAESVLNGSEVGGLKNVHAYWQAAAFVPNPCSRGYQIYQINPLGQLPLEHARANVNVTQNDYKGSQAIFASI